jgi:hypothetical protein
MEFFPDFRIKEAEMPKLRSYIVLGLLTCLLLPAEAAAINCAWVESPVESEAWDFVDQSMEWFMAYDKREGRMTAIISDISYNHIEVYKFIDSSWIKDWEGSITPGDPKCHDYVLRNIYFDENLGWLVLWASGTSPDPYSECAALFKYIPGNGLEKIADVGVEHCQHSWVPVAYDTNRKRAVYTGVFLGEVDGVWRNVTVEFDGNNLFFVPNISADPDDSILAFDIGWSGYDPISERVVVYGQRLDKYSFETWEYDGQTWTLVAEEGGPPSSLSLMGMVYVPELGGLLALYPASTLTASWLYRSRQWSELEVQGQLESYYLGMLAIDSEMRLPVFYGGWDSHGDFSNKMWELRCGGHCRPVSRP